MDDRLKDKLAKVLALVSKGSTEGEKQAAKKALQRMIDKYNINPEELGSISKKRYRFKYTTDMEIVLLGRLVRFVLNNDTAWAGAVRHTYRQKECTIDDRHKTSEIVAYESIKEISVELEYFDYVTLSASYEYFRRHMKAEWKEHCAPLVKRCRTSKTRNNKRKELKGVFLGKYLIASGLYKQEEVGEVDLSKVSAKEREIFNRMSDVQGGKYNRQLNNGLLLDHQSE